MAGRRYVPAANHRIRARQLFSLYINTPHQKVQAGGSHALGSRDRSNQGACRGCHVPKQTQTICVCFRHQHVHAYVCVHAVLAAVQSSCFSWNSHSYLGRSGDVCSAATHLPRGPTKADIRQTHIHCVHTRIVHPKAVLSRTHVCSFRHQSPHNSHDDHAQLPSSIQAHRVRHSIGRQHSSVPTSRLHAGTLPMQRFSPSGSGLI